MAIKCTMLFTYSSNGNGANTRTRTAGWSETFYSVGLYNDALKGAFERLCVLRAAMLPRYSAVIGQRYQAVSPAGASSQFDKFFPGYTSFAADVPTMSLQCKVIAAGTRNTRNLKLKGIPDDQVLFGEFQPTTAFNRALFAFLNELKNTGWSFRGRDLSQTQYPIFTISPVGDDAQVMTEGATTFAQGNFVRVLRTLTAEKRKVGGRFRIKALVGANSFTLENWTEGKTKGGQIRLDAIVYPLIGDSTPVKIGSAKVGRPFDVYHGRRSNRP